MATEPLHASEVITLMQRVMERHGDLPVHILDMEDDSKDEKPWDGLVTHVEYDCYSGEQGGVVALCAWRSRDADSGGG